MMMTRKYWLALVALSGMVAACYGGGEVPVEGVQGEEEEVTGEAEGALTCEQECQATLTSCTFSCPPDDPSLPTNYCLDDCYSGYQQCANESYAFSQSGNTICHLDIDQYATQTEVEFYTVDLWRDTSCAHQSQVRYRKRRVATVSCSTWTGLTNPSVCTTRVNNKIAELVSQGYSPTFTQSDVDQCPTPRI